MPYRAMIQDLLLSENNLSNFHLLYLERSGSHMFSDVWSAAEARQADILLLRDEAAFFGELDRLVPQCGENAQYFASGKPFSVKMLIANLKSRNVNNIIKDIYSGY
ncbi:MAG: hypothetical protein H7X86_07380 [Gorillibacterium sp.]|nr:hypothetical protein [Gorillibacterium sp.]